MPKYWPRAATALLSACCAGLGQAQELPKEISGRWTWAARNVGQSFSLENIHLTDPSSFSANLTWWTINERCSLRGEPVSGHISGAMLTFEATTKCKDSFAAELRRTPDGWEGTATSKGGAPVVIELKAK